MRDHDDDTDEYSWAEEIAALRQSMILRIMRDINAAALRVQLIEEGQSSWGDKRDSHSLDLLRMLPIVLRLTEPKPSPVSY